MLKLEVDGEEYKRLLNQYVQTNNREYLDKAKEISSSFPNRNIYPEDLYKIYRNAVEALHGKASTEYYKSLEFLLESLISYKDAADEYEKMKLERLELRSEIQIAANMQKELLKTDIPQIKGLDIGAISIPYHQLNGDYIHFLGMEDGTLGVAISDVAGKGVPAALAMSMIKYAVESCSDEEMSPSEILRKLNRIVEKNVALGMFVTMFYGQYCPKNNIFRFASAGHEPGFIYRAKEKRFVEIKAEGLVLGVLKNIDYEQYETNLEKGDMIVLLTDGVTECRSIDRFIEREEVFDIIKQYDHLPAKQHAEKVYMHFNELVDFELKDDFTLIIIKKTD